MNDPAVHPDKRRCMAILGAEPQKWRALCLIGIGHPAEHKPPRIQFPPTKVSHERVGKHRRS